MRLLLSALRFPSTPAVLHAKESPVALVAGEEHGDTETTALKKYAVPGLSGVIIEEAGKFLEADDFGRYGMVILASAPRRAWSTGEVRKIQDYDLNPNSELRIPAGPLEICRSLRRAA